MPCGNIDLGQHRRRQWLGAWWHKAINLTNIDLSSVRPSEIHLRANKQDKPQPSITEISHKITYLKFHSNLRGANEWNPKAHGQHFGSTTAIQSASKMLFWARIISEMEHRSAFPPSWLVKGNIIIYNSGCNKKFSTYVWKCCVQFFFSVLKE